MEKCTDNMAMRLKRARSRALAVVLCVTLLFQVTGLTGCKIVNNITSGFNTAQKTLSEAELARLITKAVMSEENVADCFSRIPESQRDGLSYSVFFEYCSVLRTCTKEHGTPDSFRFLTEEEKTEYYRSINNGIDQDIQSVDAYGEMDIIELCFDNDNDPKAPPVRFTIAKNDDSYSVAGQYITDSMLAYHYIYYYFEMLNNNDENGKNIDGLEAIIKMAYDSDIYLNSVIRAKAEYTVRYYKTKVKSDLEDYELKLFSPTHISYVIPEVFTEDGNSINSKTVTLRLMKDRTFSLEDDIPASIDEIRFCKNGANILRMGSTYTNAGLKRIMGEPIVESYENGVVVLTFKGITLRLETDPSGDSQWTSGRLSSVVIRNDDVYSLGENIYIGMNVSELLLIYPMLDDCGYTSSFENGDGEFILSFRFDDYGNVTRIRLGEKIN